jgi:hypothetical protein
MEPGFRESGFAGNTPALPLSSAALDKGLPVKGMGMFQRAGQLFFSGCVFLQCKIIPNGAGFAL